LEHFFGGFDLDLTVFAVAWFVDFFELASFFVCRGVRLVKTLRRLFFIIYLLVLKWKAGYLPPP